MSLKQDSDGKFSYHGMASNEASISPDALCSGVHFSFVVYRPDGLYANKVFTHHSLQVCKDYCEKNGWSYKTNGC